MTFWRLTNTRLYKQWQKINKFKRNDRNCCTFFRGIKIKTCVGADDALRTTATSPHHQITNALLRQYFNGPHCRLSNPTAAETVSTPKGGMEEEEEEEEDGLCMFTRLRSSHTKHAYAYAYAYAYGMVDANVITASMYWRIVCHYVVLESVTVLSFPHHHRRGGGGGGFLD